MLLQFINLRVSIKILLIVRGKKKRCPLIILLIFMTTYYGYNTAMNNVAIIGGGAAGLMAALAASQAGANVTLFEHNKNIGKKILASGNGRCNIINTTAYSSDYFGTSPEFVTYALEAMPFQAFERFCLSIGLLLDTKDDGRCYPLSNEAKSVVNAFSEAIKQTNIKVKPETYVTQVLKENQKFLVITEETKTPFDKVLITTGSEAAPQLGATADGYAFATAFGHTVEPTYPALVQLHLDSEIHHLMSGVKTVAEVTLYLNGKPQEKVLGDTLFTKYGISGLSILDLSQKASLALIEFQAVSVGLNLLPQFNRQSLATQLEKLFQAIPKYSLEQALSGMIALKITPHLIKSAKLDPLCLVSTLNTKQIKKIAHTLQDWRFDVTQTHGFKHAEVSGGGVRTADINEKTMESKLVKGLFFAGEVLDVVGKRGGYNFNFAWASGLLAGKALTQ